MWLIALTVASAGRSGRIDRGHATVVDRVPGRAGRWAAGLWHRIGRRSVLLFGALLYGIGGIAAATVGAISSAGQHAGTGSGLTGAGQMAAGAIAGSIIVGLGGARNFQLAAAGLILMSLVSVASIAYVYRRRSSPD